MSDTPPWNPRPGTFWHDAGLGMRLDLSRMGLPDDPFAGLDVAGALAAMHDLEKGATANPDEDRRVGHYWLRDPDLAPDDELRDRIEETRRRIRAFVREIHRGTIRPQIPGVDRFRHLLVVGIGGSALGPQFVADALGHPGDAMEVHYLDNTDPDGFDRVLRDDLDHELHRTLVVVISKSGGTRETRNGMFETEAAFERHALDFPKHTVAVTGEGSALEDYAKERGFLEVFPMWDWVGGRTSVTSAVGLLPMALQGLDIDAFLEGAREMDACTRRSDPAANPAAMLAAAWHHAGRGRGDRNLVLLPYKDRLLLLGRYLQQLVMESLGKSTDLAGKTVHQGLTVYGNKGSTDQHAFVQQLRDGRDDAMVGFVQVLRDRNGGSLLVEEDVTSGDYLLGFLLGTRAALDEAGRPSFTLGLPDVSPRSLGALVALFERTVGLYASLVGINAYHQPGVEAGKKAAAEVLDLQRRVLAALREADGPHGVAEIAAAAGSDDLETVCLVLEHAAANPDHPVTADGGTPWTARYGIETDA
jgi:glucose-6-phosphate isomerase